MTGGQRRTQTERVAESAKRLLESAIELISEQGYEATSATQISLHAGYSRTMVQARYGSKEVLLDTVLRFAYEDRIQAPLPAGTTGLDRIHARIATLLQILAEDGRFLRAILTLSFEAVGSVAPLRPHLEAWLIRAEAELREAIVESLADGSARAGIDPTAAAREGIETIIGIAYRWALTRDQEAFTRDLLRWEGAFQQRHRRSARP